MKRISLFIILFGLVFGLGIHFAHADSTSSQVGPQITQNGSSLTVAFPQNYSGEVTSTYDSQKGWQTTTKPFSQSDIDAMNKQFADQQKQLQAFWKSQDDFFAAQQKFFDSLWGATF